MISRDCSVSFSRRSTGISTILIILVVASLLPLYVRPVGAVSYLPGVAPGATSLYGNVTASWQSNNPSVTPPPFISEFLNVKSVSLLIQTVQAANITATQTFSFTNGTGPRAFNISGSVANGQGNLTFWILAGGLTAGNPIYSAPGSPTLNRTATTFIAGSSRQVEILEFNPTELGGVFIDLSWSWDTTTGILASLVINYSESSPATTFNGHVNLEITKTSLWSSTPDYFVSAFPNVLAVKQGFSGTAIVTVTSLNNFAGTINLTLTVTPSGPSVTPTTSSVPVVSGGSSSGFFNIATSNSTALGSYTITVTGTNGTSSRSATISLTVVSPTPSQLSLDGSGQGFCDHSTNSCTAQLTTTHSDDIIIAYTVEALDLQPSCTFTLSDNASLSWNARSNVAFDRTGRGQLQEFWARSVGTLTSDTVTESILGCAGVFGGEYNGLMIFGVSGANFSTPFDPNVTLPASVNGFSGDTSVSVSTSNPSDMIISGMLHGTINPVGAGQGFTLITMNPVAIDATEYQTVNALETNMNVTFTDTVADGWIQVADALQAGSTKPGLAIYAQPGTINISPPGNGSTTINLASINGFTGTLSLHVGVPPPGFTATLQPSQVTLSAGGTAQATLSVAAQTNSSSRFDLIVFASGGQLNEGVKVHVQSMIVPPPSFRISAPTFLSVMQGQSTNAIIIVSSVNNFSGTVNLSVGISPNLSNGPSITISPSQVFVGPAPSPLVFFSVFTAQSTALGTYNYTITGKASVGGGFLSEVVIGRLVVTPAPPPDFSLNAFPTFQTIFAGSSATSEIEVFPAGPTGSSNFTVILSAQVPVVQGLSATLNPSSITIGPSVFSGLSTLNINTEGTTPPGNYTIIVTGHAGPFTHSVQIQVNIVPPPTIKITPTRGQVGTKVLVQGTGFLVEYGSTEILVTFDDQLVGFTFTSNGSFNFTFNVPEAQAGQHTVKATEQLFGINNSEIVVTAPFQVLPNPNTISVTMDTGTVYFPGDTATFFIIVTVNGQATTQSDVQLTLQLTLPNGTVRTLIATPSSNGLYAAKFTFPAMNSLGTYAALVKAHSASSGDSSALKSFEVKPTWLSQHGSVLATGAAVTGLVAIVGIAWQQGFLRKKKDDAPLDWNAGLARP